MNKIQEIIFYLCNLIVQDRIFSRLFHSVSVIFTWALIEGTSNGDLSEKLFRENIYTGKKQLEQTQDPATPLQTQENGNFQMKIITWDDGSQKSGHDKKNHSSPARSRKCPAPPRIKRLPHSHKTENRGKPALSTSRTICWTHSIYHDSPHFGRRRKYTKS